MIASRHWGRLWPTVAIGLIVVGSTASLAAGIAVARAAAEQSRRSFLESSTAMASTLKLGSQHEEDLVVNAIAFLSQNPDSSAEHFQEWANAAHVVARYPELRALGLVEIVPASELGAFTAEVSADPATPLAAGTWFHVVPSGDRPFYCLTTLQLQVGSEPLTPPGSDYCGGDAGAAGLSARDSGIGGYVSSPIGADDTWLIVHTPIYHGGETPATVNARREAFVGWLEIAFDPNILLARALADHNDLGVVFRLGEMTFQSGNVSDGRYRHSTDIGNGWAMETYGNVDNHGLLQNWSALGLTAAGIAVSGLLAALTLVLSTGRIRALGLVRDKTDELTYQTLHDALTGLPNRTLIMDRLEQLLARSRRNGTTWATLFLDLDGFKNVNDTLGHAAGDDLLQSVAERLTATLRDADTIGRMGGDEFVILIDGGTLDVAPQLFAQRVLEAMRQPFELDAGPAPVVVTVSIGIATATGKTPGDALRAADIALYEAKGAGRDRYAIFRPEMEAGIRMATSSTSSQRPYGVAP